MRRAPAPVTRDPAPSPEADKAILAEQVRVLIVEGQRLILTGVAAALILVWVLWDHVPRAILLGWLAAFCLYSLVRAAMARAWRRRSAGDVDHRDWLRRVQWALAVGGSIWAAACFLFYVPDRIEYQLFLVTMLLGAVVSGLVTLAVYLPAYLAFVTPFVAATAIRYGQGGDPLHWGIALAAVVTFFLFINFARYIQNSFVESLRLRMALAERNREVERANLAKSRFLAAASHDLRQPLHALGLFVAAAGATQKPTERSAPPRRPHRCRRRVDERAVRCAARHLQARRRRAGADAARIFPSTICSTASRRRSRPRRARRGCSSASCRAAPGCAATPSCSSASCSTSCPMRCATRRAAASLVGCRRRGDSVRIEVWDTGPASPRTSSQNIFGEFYQLGAPGSASRRAGSASASPSSTVCAGCSTIRSSLRSTSGKGSRFSIEVPSLPRRGGAVGGTRPASLERLPASSSS